jgi:hypothetical protein
MAVLFSVGVRHKDDAQDMQNQQRIDPLAVRAVGREACPDLTDN